MLKITNFKNNQVDWFGAISQNKLAVKNLCEYRIKTILGEIWTSPNLGIPYLDKINDKETMDLYIQNEIRKIKEVENIDLFVSEYSNSRYEIKQLTIISNNEKVVVK